MLVARPWELMCLTEVARQLADFRRRAILEPSLRPPMRTGVREPEWSAEAGVGTLFETGLGTLPFVAVKDT